MAITRWTPNREAMSLWNDFDRFFNRLTKSDLFDNPDSDFTGSGTWMPALDVTEKEKEYIVEAEVPGMSEDDIQLSLRDNVLTIKGEKKFESEEDEDNYYYRERRYGQFQRSIRLDGGVDDKKVDAEYSNGVLTIHLPKSKETMAKQIPVKSKKK